MAQITYYSNANKENYTLEIPQELASRINKATTDYNTSFKLIRQHYFYLWCQAIKDYELSTYDRQELPIKKWQSNIPYGLIRQTIDVFISSILETTFCRSYNA